MTTLGYLRGVREWAYPARTKSAFLEKGVLTPQEFVQAGDELVFRCPTWSWEAGDPAKAKSHLPPDKQYLVTRNVPCPTRVAAMENTLAEDMDGEEGDWLVSTIIQRKDDDDDFEDDFAILDEEGEVVAKPKPSEPETNTNQEDAVEEDEYADMDEYEDDNIILDDAAAVGAGGEGSSGDNVVKVRTYDLSITYDKYYQTPRVWMVGKSTTGQPLSGKEMMEDVISDYANRTVTIENHPNVAGPHASIHPCQHGKVMKAIVRNLMKSANDGEEEKAPLVEMYLFIFLKFVSSIIPTITYDFTMDVTADTSK